MWKQDRFGNILPEPVKIKDDAMDAMLYGLQDLRDNKRGFSYSVTKV